MTGFIISGINKMFESECFAVDPEVALDVAARIWDEEEGDVHVSVSLEGV